MTSPCLVAKSYFFARHVMFSLQKRDSLKSEHLHFLFHV